MIGDTPHLGVKAVAGTAGIRLLCREANLRTPGGGGDADELARAAIILSLIHISEPTRPY